METKIQRKEWVQKEEGKKGKGSNGILSHPLAGKSQVLSPPFCCSATEQDSEPPVVYSL